MWTDITSTIAECKSYPSPSIYVEEKPSGWDATRNGLTRWNKVIPLQLPQTMFGGGYKNSKWKRSAPLWTNRSVKDFFKVTTYLFPINSGFDTINELMS